MAPVLDELGRDYAERYPHFDTAREMSRYPVEAFLPPDGEVLVLEDTSAPGSPVVASGAFMRLDAATAEVKRVWTSTAHRRQGLAARIVAALEQAAQDAGYSRVFLTTGPRQPEARALYLALGYRAIGDHDAVVARADAPLPFDKDLVPAAGPAGDGGSP